MAQRRVARIVSGGQTGADRAGLDIAVELGLDYGGWCPRFGWAEDHPTPPGLLTAYPALRETESSDPAVRTRLNVRDSHATLIVRSSSPESQGTDLTEDCAREMGRPCLVTSGTEVDPVIRWLDSLQAEVTLNVAGPRESEQPGIYEATRNLLRALLQAQPGVRAS